MHIIEILMYAYVALFGIVVGSFLNVCILRLPLGQSIITEPSHCFSCNKKLKPYELVPLFSWIFLGGKCSKCKSRISIQYPLIEAFNGLLWVIVFHYYGLTSTAILGAILSSTLIVLSVIDFRTQEILPEISRFLFILGAIMLFLNLSDWKNHLLGMISISGLLFIIVFFSGGDAMGGGDVKMMLGCGLFLGLLPTIASFLIACIVGSVIHLIRMKFFGADRTLALGPYLSIGVFISFIWGDSLISWYLSILTI